MSAGVPVVATNRGGTPEVIRSGTDGFLHDPDDLPGMVSNACALLTTKKLRARIVKSAKERARSEFHVERIAKKYLSLYRSLLNGEGASRQRPRPRPRSTR